MIRSIWVACALGVAAASQLAACSTPASAPGTPAAAQEQATPDGDESRTMVGSRIPRKSTDRLVRQTGAAGAAEMERNRPPDPGPRTQ